MKKSERVCAIVQTLTDNPNRDFSLGAFASRFDCAKSSISEDIKLVRDAIAKTGYGYIETTSGSKGGVRFVPSISSELAQEIMEEIKTLFEEPDRRLGSGFLYTSDIMFNPRLAKGAARIFARHFANVEADMVVTVETKGIAIALFTAELLDLPLAVIRRESKISEGSTVSINFFSGSADRLQKMSLSKRALKPGTRAIIIDDFMRGGGSIKGMEDMLKEFEAVHVGIGVVVAAESPGDLKIGDYFPLLFMKEDDSGVPERFLVNPSI